MEVRLVDSSGKIDKSYKVVVVGNTVYAEKDGVRIVLMYK